MLTGHEENQPGAIVMLMTSPLTEDPHTTKAVDATRYFTQPSPRDLLPGKHWSSKGISAVF